jgi:hypothetical protein
MKLINTNSLTPEQRQQLAAAARKKRPDAKYRAEFARLILRRGECGTRTSHDHGETSMTTSDLAKLHAAADEVINIIHARKIFIHRQIDRAWEIAEHYRALNDPTSAATFEDWACRAEFELEQWLATAGHAKARARRITMASIRGHIKRCLADSGREWRQITPHPSKARGRDA